MILKFVKTLQCNVFEFLKNHIKIEYSIYKSWDESYTPIGVHDLPKLTRYDFFKLQDSSLVNVNIEYREFFSRLLDEYYKRIEILQKRKSKAKSQYLQLNLSNQISELEKIINEYQQIVSKPKNNLNK